MVLRWGLEKAEEKDSECRIKARPMGFRLYRILGWVEIDRVDMSCQSTVAREVRLIGWLA